MEQLNIVGKRSGEGIVTHRATMVNVLSRGLAERVVLMDFTIGRKGLLNYIKSLAGSNIVKIVPTSNGSASDERADGKKRLKVVCGSFQSSLDDMAWIGDKTAYSLADVRFTSANTLTPNIGSTELAEAIAKVLPFTSSEDSRPVLQNVLFQAVDGKLKLVGADGFVLAECILDLDTGESEAVKVLVNRADLKGIPSALRKAKRVRLSFDKAGETLDGMAMFIDTEVARYKFIGAIGDFPNYGNVIPSEFSCTAQLDAQEALKAVYSLKTTSENAKDYAIDLTVGGGSMVMANTDETGEVVITADSGEGMAVVRLDGKYFTTGLKAIGGMVDFGLNKPHEPVMLWADGLKVVIMPIMSQQAREAAKAEQPQAEVEGEQPQAEQEAVGEQEAEQPQAEVEGVDEVEAEPAEAELEAIEAEEEAVGEQAVDELAEQEAEADKPKRSRRGRQKVAVA